MHVDVDEDVDVEAQTKQRNEALIFTFSRKVAGNIKFREAILLLENQIEASFNIMLHEQT